MFAAKMIGVTVKLDVMQDIDTVYGWVIDPSAAPKFLQGIKSYELLDRDWTQVGARRRITLDNGATLLETIKTISHSEHFGYELTEFSGMSRLVKIFIARGSSQCWFTDGKAGGTHIVWRFSYEPRNVLVIPFLWVFMNTAYRSYMRSAARRIKRFSEEQV